MKALNYKTANVMRSIAASLIILASFSGIAKGENPGNEATEIVENESELAVEGWMNDSNYWMGESNVEEQELALNIESWMNDNAYWGELYVNEEIESLPSLAVESWMNSNNYWNGNAENDEQELALEIEAWMNDNTYWTGSEEQINCGNELANN